ncbi:MAG: OsmC family protein [Bacteroidota bacterium]|nr:OsmC family protein [Bacteroidota bacterium]
MKRTAKAHWEGTLKDGKGTLTSESGILNDTNYNFKTRFEGDSGTNPEELLAAAHAGCFTMSVSAMIAKKGITPVSLDTEATVTLEDLKIMGVHLNITGNVPGLTLDEFKTITKDAEQNCVISKALAVPITSEANFYVEDLP